MYVPKETLEVEDGLPKDDLELAGRGDFVSKENRSLDNLQEWKITIIIKNSLCLGGGPLNFSSERMGTPLQ